MDKTRKQILQNMVTNLFKAKDQDHYINVCASILKAQAEARAYAIQKELGIETRKG